MSPPSQPFNPLFPQTGHLFSHSLLIALGARTMSDAPAQIGFEATEAMEPTTVATPAPALAPAPASESAPAPDGAEDIEMVGSTPTAAPAPAQSSTPVAPVSETPVQPVQQQQQPAAQIVSAPLSAPSPVPASTSARNSPHPSGPAQVPVHAVLHGAPARQYLNSHVTPHLLEGMKHLVTLEYAFACTDQQNNNANAIIDRRNRSSF
jgi:COMPASS component SDC1